MSAEERAKLVAEFDALAQEFADKVDLKQQFKNFGTVWATLNHKRIQMAAVREFFAKMRTDINGPTVFREMFNEDL